MSCLHASANSIFTQTRIAQCLQCLWCLLPRIRSAKAVLTMAEPATLKQQPVVLDRFAKQQALRVNAQKASPLC
jgi:hypothetical protein